MQSIITYSGNLIAEQKDALKTQLSRGERNRPLVFGGRQNILGHIKAQLQALQSSPESIDSITQIVHGAPGAGKSSLLNKLAEQFGQEAVFIHVNGDDLSNRDQFLSQLLLAAQSNVDRLNVTRTNKNLGEVNFGLTKGTHERGTTTASHIETRAVRTVWDLLEEALNGQSDAVIVMCVDEAQTIRSESSDRTINSILLQLHTCRTNNLRILPIFAGLNDTEDALEACGVSRSDELSTFHLSSLSVEEARAVVIGVMTLERFGLASLFTREQIDLIATTIATASQWPRHLHYYILGVLIAVSEDQERATPHFTIDLGRAVEYGHDARVRYYERQARKVDSEFVESISKLLSMRSMPCTKQNLRDLAHTEFGISNGSFRTAYQNAIHIGLIEEDGAGSQSRFDIPIPSLQTFLVCDCNIVRTKQKLREEHRISLKQELDKRH